MATTNQIPFQSMNPQGALEPGDAVASCDEGMERGPNQKVTYSKRTFYPCLSHVFYMVRQSTKCYQKKLVSMGKQRGVGQSLRARAAKLVMSRVSQNLDHWFDGLSEN